MKKVTSYEVSASKHKRDHIREETMHVMQDCYTRDSPKEFGFMHHVVMHVDPNLLKRSFACIAKGEE